MRQIRDIKEVFLWDTFMIKNAKKDKISFGQQLKKLRQVKGLTQTELGRLIGASTRMVEHYENHATYPPIALIPAITKALKISADELLGIKDFKDDELVKIKNLMRRFKTVSHFPLRDQRAVFNLIGALKAKHASRSHNKNGA